MRNAFAEVPAQSLEIDLPRHTQARLAHTTTRIYHPSTTSDERRQLLDEQAQLRSRQFDTNHRPQAPSPPSQVRAPEPINSPQPSVGSRALESAGQFVRGLGDQVSDVVHAVTHPRETLTALRDLAGQVIEDPVGSARTAVQAVAGLPETLGNNTAEANARLAGQNAPIPGLRQLAMAGAAVRLRQVSRTAMRGAREMAEPTTQAGRQLQQRLEQMDRVNLTATSRDGAGALAPAARERLLGDRTFRQDLAAQIRNGMANDPPANPRARQAAQEFLVYLRALDLP